jgi:hypothetical protein
MTASAYFSKDLFMKTKIGIIVASFALILSANTGAQQSQKQQSDQQQKAAMEKCNGMQGNAKDICKAEADGQKKVDEAQAKMTEHDSPKTRLDLANAKAEAQYNGAKARCGDQVGDAKKACEDEAKAAQNLAKAQAKRASLTQASGAQNVSSGSSGSSGSTGSGASEGSAPAK